MNGGTSGYGTLFKVEVESGELTTVVSFTKNGATNKGAVPIGRLTNDAAGFFWGTTKEGGANNFGTVFKVNRATGALTTVVEFSGNGASNKGAKPFAGLFRDGSGTLWGTTREGGSNNMGTLFKLNATTGALTTVVEFTINDATNKGSNPQGELASDGSGSLWGTTFAGGTAGAGTIYKVDTTTGVLTTVVELAAAGRAPFAGLVSDGSGNFVGTTSEGGALNFGTVFRINATSGLLTTLVEFTGAGKQANCGQTPGYATLLKHTDGYFYGTTLSGGPGGGGVIYRVPVAP
jgi:uncharacterized repeat protein (TIGR03803 family)